MQPMRTVAALLAVLVLAGSPGARAQETDTSPGVPLQDVLRGEVVSVRKDGRIEVRYDLTDPAQLQDFELHRPFRVEGLLEHDVHMGALRMNGTGGLLWKPVLRDLVELEADVLVERPRDLGAFVAEARPTDHFVIYSIFDQYFQEKDSGPGAAKQHMICRFLPASRDFAGELVFRYVCRGTRPEIEGGDTVHLALGKDGHDDWMTLGDDRIKGTDRAWAPLRGLRPGFYVLDSKARFRNIVIRGRLDPEWALGAGVDLSQEIEGKAGPREKTAADVDADRLVDGYRAGEGRAARILEIMGTDARHPDTRTAAADALIESADGSVVPLCVPYLESEDEVTRTHAGRVVKELAGRNFGFKPDADLEKRRKAVRSLLEYIRKNPAKFR